MSPQLFWDHTPRNFSSTPPDFLDLQLFFSFPQLFSMAVKVHIYCAAQLFLRVPQLFRGVIRRNFLHEAATFFSATFFWQRNFFFWQCNFFFFAQLFLSLHNFFFFHATFLYDYF
ncbi:hypothetical protein BDQ17DRAFT_827073 [Cyathus striatus]|nr:hypothetical protein BDQ17DRAFT_827073 [Cyathus striatus]